MIFVLSFNYLYYVLPEKEKISDLKMAVFSVLTPRILVEIYRRRYAYYPHQQGDEWLVTEAEGTSETSVNLY
jgi:hypothetical protein